MIFWRTGFPYLKPSFPPELRLNGVAITLIKGSPARGISGGSLILIQIVLAITKSSGN
jgi:hypothetical protein